MALAKKAAIDASSPARTPEAASIARLSRVADENRKNVRTHARQQKAAERIAAATGELAAGVAQSSAAAEELRKAMEFDRRRRRRGGRSFRSVAQGRDHHQLRPPAGQDRRRYLAAEDRIAARARRRYEQTDRGQHREHRRRGRTPSEFGGDDPRARTPSGEHWRHRARRRTHRRSNESARVECGD